MRAPECWLGHKFVHPTFLVKYAKNHPTQMIALYFTVTRNKNTTSTHQMPFRFFHSALRHKKVICRHENTNGYQ